MEYFNEDLHELDFDTPPCGDYYSSSCSPELLLEAQQECLDIEDALEYLRAHNYALC